MLHDLTVRLRLYAAGLSSNHRDGDFTTDLGSIHALQVHESLQSLGDVDFDINRMSEGYPNASTVTEEYVEDAMRWILEPWNKRGILNIHYKWHYRP